MIIHDVAQGSPEWFAARLGIPTASAFDKIITPAKGELSKQALPYACKLIAERLLNRSLETMEASDWMSRGKELEAWAAKKFEFEHEIETVTVGLITTDDGRLGCSPDRLVKGRAIGVEIKVPSDAVHVRYMIAAAEKDPLVKMPVEYRPQVQGQLLVAELEMDRLYSYHHEMPAALFSVPRDEPYIAKMRAALDQFNAELFDLLERVRAMGVFQAHAEAATPLEVERAAGLADTFRQDFGLQEDFVR